MSKCSECDCELWLEVEHANRCPQCGKSMSRGQPLSDSERAEGVRYAQSSIAYASRPSDIDSGKQTLRWAATVAERDNRIAELEAAMLSPLITMVPVVDAIDMPQEVEDYCVEHEINTHYSTELYLIEDDGNVFAEWLKSLGYKFTPKSDVHLGGDWVGVFGS